jgi:hypothetical protein
VEMPEYIRGLPKKMISLRRLALRQSNDDAGY